MWWKTTEAELDIFKLSNKYSHSSKTFIFETGSLPYHDGMRLMLQTMNIIDYFGYTDDRCELEVGISINERKLNLPAGISKLNKFKYLIGLEEDKILDSWNTNKTESNPPIKVYWITISLL